MRSGIIFKKKNYLLTSVDEDRSHSRYVCMTCVNLEGATIHDLTKGI